MKKLYIELDVHILYLSYCDYSVKVIVSVYLRAVRQYQDVTVIDLYPALLHRLP